MTTQEHNHDEPSNTESLGGEIMHRASEDICGYINIAMGGRQCDRLLSSNSIFFETKAHYIIKINEEKIVISKATIDYEGKTYKATALNGKGWISFSVIADLPLGKFSFDADETNQDAVTIYYR
jgi:hypothetical protein